ncbi:site-specific integrase [Streptomyces griseoviridis]|uniref:site-specific integrase n=1 Tax=Streptomyces griseoviridis TaxID=45398 RepID=UPI0038228E05
MVWTPEQTGQFIDFVAEDRLYPLWRPITFRGTRRGEACGVRWLDHSAAAQSLAIATQLVQDGWEIHEGAPKTDSGIRLIALDDETHQVLLRHKAGQEQQREAWGDGWQDTGRIFTEVDGSLLHPGKVSDLFERLAAAAGLPPIRLHDLRHVSATLMLAAGFDIKVVSETLGHPHHPHHPHHPRHLPGCPGRSRPRRREGRATRAPGPEAPQGGQGTPRLQPPAAGRG